jgi:hypothetical protein
MGLLDGDPICRFCRKETETVEHIICCCEALSLQRYNVFGNTYFEPKYISTASVRDLCHFIGGTGLLNLYWMEYLGLHNKPKAEVHPGHKLTGTKEEDKELQHTYLMLHILQSILYHLLHVSFRLEPSSRIHKMNINCTIALQFDTHMFLSTRPMIMRK